MAFFDAGLGAKRFDLRFKRFEDIVIMLDWNLIYEVCIFFQLWYFFWWSLQLFTGLACKLKRVRFFCFAMINKRTQDIKTRHVDFVKSHWFIWRHLLLYLFMSLLCNLGIASQTLSDVCSYTRVLHYLFVSILPC